MWWWGGWRVCCGAAGGWRRCRSIAPAGWSGRWPEPASEAVEDAPGRLTDKQREGRKSREEKSKQQRQTWDRQTSQKQTGRQTSIGVIRRQSTVCISVSDCPRVGNIKGLGVMWLHRTMQKCTVVVFKGLICEHMAELSQFDFSTMTGGCYRSHPIRFIHFTWKDQWGDFA